MTGERNGRLSRTIVNRIWARLLGRGLVEPVDDMEQPAWHPDLLDWLAADLVDHGYDLKRTLEVILTSQAYQLPAVAATEQPAAEFVFRGPTVRRLSAEQFLDAVSQITGVWNMLPTARANFQPATPPPTDSLPARWIWTNPDAGTSAPPRPCAGGVTSTWRRLRTRRMAVVACDNEFKLFVNGRQIGSGKDFARPAVGRSERRISSRDATSSPMEAVNAPAKPDEPEPSRPARPGCWRS